jgi:hypothetical protein
MEKKRVKARLTKQQFKFLTSFNLMKNKDKEIFSIPYFFIRNTEAKGLVFDVFTIEELLEKELNGTEQAKD